MWVKT